MLSFFPRCVFDEILNLIESVSEDFPSYSLKTFRLSDFSTADIFSLLFMSYVYLFICSFVQHYIYIYKKQLIKIPFPVGIYRKEKQQLLVLDLLQENIFEIILEFIIDFSSNLESLGIISAEDAAGCYMYDYLCSITANFLI